MKKKSWIFVILAAVLACVGAVVAFIISRANRTAAEEEPSVEEQPSAQQELTGETEASQEDAA